MGINIKELDADGVSETLHQMADDGLIPGVWSLVLCGEGEQAGLISVISSVPLDETSKILEYGNNVITENSKTEKELH